MPVIDAKKNKAMKNKYSFSLGNLCAKSLKIESDIPCPKNTKIISHKYFFLKLNFLEWVIEHRYIPKSAKKNASDLKQVNLSSYNKMAKDTGIIKLILFAIVVMAIPTFCVPDPYK